MSFTLVDIFSYAVAIAALIGLARLFKIDRAYWPFILLLWVALLNEALGTFFIRVFHSNAVNSNIYVLLESLLLLWFFERVGLFQRKRRFFYFFLAAFTVGWVVENLIIFTITEFHSYFRVFYSFVIVLMSIDMINRLFSVEKKKLIKHPLFLILVGFIAYFTYKALVEIFWIYGLNAGREFRIEVYRIMVYVNLAVNLLYAIAVLWIPRKREYILQ